VKKKTISKYKWDRIRDSVQRRDVQRFGVYDKNGGQIELIIFDIYLKGFLYRYEHSCGYWSGYGRPDRWYRYDLREV